VSHSPIVSPEAWLAARTALLTEQEAFTRQGDAIDAQRRRLPMVKVTKDYVFTSTFNHDFHVTIDAAVAPTTYDHREIAADTSFEVSGYSVFLRIEDEVFRSYSTYERGTEKLADAVCLVGLTPYGRQKEWEDSPPGWPRRAALGQLHRQSRGVHAPVRRRSAA